MCRTSRGRKAHNQSHDDRVIHIKADDIIQNMITSLRWEVMVIRDNVLNAVSANRFVIIIVKPTNTVVKILIMFILDTRYSGRFSVNKSSKTSTSYDINKIILTRSVDCLYEGCW